MVSMCFTKYTFLLATNVARNNHSNKHSTAMGTYANQKEDFLLLNIKILSLMMMTINVNGAKHSREFYILFTYKCVIAITTVDGRIIITFKFLSAKQTYIS